MATVLLIGAGLLVRSIVALVNVPVGFETESLLTARLSLPRPNDTTRATYLDPARRVAFYRETLDRIAALAGRRTRRHVVADSDGRVQCAVLVEIQGLEAGGQAVRPVMHNFQISPSYFETMGVRILRGRPFTDLDRADERAGRDRQRNRGAHVLEGPGSGRRTPSAWLRTSPWMTVIGVAGDVRQPAAERTAAADPLSIARAIVRPVARAAHSHARRDPRSRASTSRARFAPSIRTCRSIR